MRYVIRAVKYFFMITIILILIMLVLVLIKAVPADISQMFRGGWKSVWQILALFAVFSAFYPKLGYAKRNADITGDFQFLRDGIIEYMDSHGYKLEAEEGEDLKFRLRSTASRISKLGEDRITMTRRLGGYTLEGITKDVNRLASGLEYKFRQE